MKYICFNHDGRETAVLFPPHVTHKDMARICRLDTPFDRGYNTSTRRLLSAGFVSFGPNGAVCKGYSESTGIGIKGNDAELINEMNFLI